MSFQVLWAQGGKEFWFAAPEITQKHGDRPILLRISAFDKAANVTISQPANPSFGVISKNVPANQLVTIDLSPFIGSIETPSNNAVSNTGLHITSSSEVSVYYEVQGIPNITTNNGYFTLNNSDIFVLKGNDALGKTFFIPMQNFWRNQTRGNLDAWASFDIVATENNTLITITPTQALFGNHPANEAFTITLQKGQTYSARALTTVAAERPTGSKVESNKPIAITYKDDSMFQGSNWDMAGDQLIPANNTGTEYIALKNSASGFFTDRLFVTATQNGTKVTAGSDTFLLDAGATQNYLLTDSCIFLQSNAPVYVFHISAFNNELGGALLPPVTCTGSKQVVFVRSTDETFSLNILVRAGGEGNFTLNSSTSIITASKFKEVKGAEGKWKFAQLFLEDEIIPEQAYTLKNSTSDFHLSTQNGDLVTGFRYGYFSGYGSVNLGNDRTICIGDSTELDAGINKDSYLWSTGETNPIITVKDTGNYFVVTTKNTCLFRDSVTVQFYPEFTSPILGNDTAVCANIHFQIKTISNFNTYLWQDKSTKEKFTPTQTGKYWVRVSNEYGCVKSDTLQFTSYPTPAPAIEFSGDIVDLCNSSIIALTATPTFAAYFWHNGDTTKQITSERTADDTYQVTVTSANGCVATAKTQIDCSPYISIPNVITPNGDNLNDIFRINNFKSDIWELEIYNKWGSRVFDAKPYHNDWQASGLPEGVYFYSLKHLENSTAYKGWLQVIR